MLIEIARFWASSVETGEGGRLEIRGVIGPDEYHDAYPGAARPGLDNNAYTNVMAAWTLRCAAGLREVLAAPDWQRLVRQTALQPDEPAAWDDVGRRLKLPLLAGDVIAQFDGFDRLLPVDSGMLAQRDPAQRADWWLLAHGDDPNRYQVTKQADVLMLFHLLGRRGVQALVEHLGYRLAAGWYERTVRHYLARITQESSLSRIVCAGALAPIDAELSWHYYRQSLHTDLGPGGSASSHEGLHLGAMAGTWDVLQRHYLGLWIERDQLRLDPHPPAALDDVQIGVCVRGHRLRLHLADRWLRVSHEGEAPSDGMPRRDADAAVRLQHRGEPLRLRAGQSVALPCR